ncbi:uncharacterized protein LOC116738623 [Nasonia vitripennis]|uniref:Uncharacterized protein n=1 Tax=Nasonia vitripennis TaxID=7425 RepID=A0A7M7QZX9_NASVI|nr:uncharacterized protein LOC116738623 [Nasonia vitripennis]
MECSRDGQRDQPRILGVQDGKFLITKQHHLQAPPSAQAADLSQQYHVPAGFFCREEKNGHVIQQPRIHGPLDNQTTKPLQHKTYVPANQEHEMMVDHNGRWQEPSLRSISTVHAELWQGQAAGKQQGIQEPPCTLITKPWYQQADLQTGSWQGQAAGQIQGIQGHPCTLTTEPWYQQANVQTGSWQGQATGQQQGTQGASYTLTTKPWHQRANMQAGPFCQALITAEPAEKKTHQNCKIQ